MYSCNQQGIPGMYAGQTRVQITIVHMGRRTVQGDSNPVL